MTLTITRELTSNTVKEPAELLLSTPTSAKAHDFVNNVVALVKESCAHEDFSQIGEKLRALKLTAPQLTKEMVSTLVTQVKEVAQEKDLPIVYSHLIQDLHLHADGDYLTLANLVPADEAFRIECAFLAAKFQPRQVLSKVYRYRIQDQAALFAIAKILAINCGYIVSQSLDQIGLKEDKHIFAIAKLLQDKCTEEMPFNIERFPIKEEALRVELAKREALLHPRNLLKDIQKYQITSEEARAEIAKIAAHQDGVETSNAIKQFSIQDPMRRLDVLLVALKQSNASISIQHVKNYGLGSVQKALLFSRYATLLEGSCALTVIFSQFIAEKNPTIEKEIVENYPEFVGFGVSKDLAQCVLDMWEEENIPFSELRSLYKRCQALTKEQDPAVKFRNSILFSLEISAYRFAWGRPDLLNTLLKEIEKIQKEENPIAFEFRARAIFSLLLECRVLKIDKGIVAQHAGILTAILDVRDRELRSNLLSRFLDGLVTSPQVVQFPSKASALTAIVLSPLLAKVKVPTDFLQRVDQAMQLKAFRKDDSKFKSLLQKLNILIETPTLSEREKIEILNTLIFFENRTTADKQAKRIFESAELVAQFISCGQERALLACRNFDDLLNGIKDLYKTKLGITLDTGIWVQTIGTWRMPQSLLTYAQTLSRLPSPDRENLLELLKKFTLSVLEGNFKTLRYAVDQNSFYMKNLSLTDPRLLEAWQKGSVLAKEEHLVVDTDHPCDLLLAGTEVGSCLSVDSDPGSSKCLVAYLLDPKIRMIAIKNKAGVTIARSIVLLLWEPKQKRYVLYQADNYCNGNNDFSKKLDAACLQRAQELGIPLYRSTPAGTTALVSFKGGGIPYEYVDALEEPVQNNRPYVIPNCTLITGI